MINRHRWSDEERDIIRRDYKHTGASRRELAAVLTVMCGETITEAGVGGQVAIMGIAKRDDRRPWSPAEEEKLATLIHRFCPRRVAKMMHRSINSVVVKSQRIKASRRARDDWFTKSEAGEILGMDHKKVQKRIDSGALVASHHHDLRPSKTGSTCWHIEAKDLKNFIRRYPDELTGRNVDLVMIVELLAGIINGNGQHVTY